MDKTHHDDYWKKNISIILRVLVVWAVVSYGAGILFVDILDNIVILGFPVGFWFANQGAIYVFIGLIVYYIRAMNKLDAEYNVDE